MPIPSIFSRRELQIELLRQPGPPNRGVGRAASGADGTPPNQTGAISAIQRLQVTRAGASPIQANPGAQATAADPPRTGHRIDVRL